MDQLTMVYPNNEGQWETHFSAASVVTSTITLSPISFSECFTFSNDTQSVLQQICHISLQKKFTAMTILMVISVLVLLINLTEVFCFSVESECYHYANFSFFGYWCFVIVALMPRTRHTSIYNFQHTSRQQQKWSDSGRLCFTRMHFSNYHVQVFFIRWL